MIKIEKNELKQVKSFFNFARKQFYSAKQWYPDTYVVIEVKQEHIYFIIGRDMEEASNNPTITRLKIPNQNNQSLEASIVFPINFIDALEASPEIIIDPIEKKINSILIPEELPTNSIDPGHSIIQLEKTCLLTFTKDQFQNFKTFITSNKNSEKARRYNEAFSYFYFEDLGKAKTSIQFTDGTRLNIFQYNFSIDSTRTIQNREKKMFIHQDYMKLLIPLMEANLKYRDEIELYIEYGQYLKNQKYLEYKHDIEVRSITYGTGRRLHFSFSIPGEEAEKYPETQKVMDHNKEKLSMIEILLDPRTREETKKLEKLKTYLQDGITLSIEKETIKLCGTLRNKQQEDAGSYEIDLTHLACIENKYPEPLKLKLPLSNFLSMIKEIGARTASLIMTNLTDPILYKTSQTEGLCCTVPDSK